MTRTNTANASIPSQFRERPDDARAWIAALGSVLLFGALSKRQQRKGAETARIRRFTDGTPLVLANEAASELFVILDGHVTVGLPDGKSVVVGAGSFVGELAILDRGPRS